MRSIPSRRIKRLKEHFKDLCGVVEADVTLEFRGSYDLDRDSTSELDLSLEVDGAAVEVLAGADGEAGAGFERTSSSDGRGEFLLRAHRPGRPL